MHRVFGHYISTGIITLNVAEVVLLTALLCMGCSFLPGAAWHPLDGGVILASFAAAVPISLVVQASRLDRLFCLPSLGSARLIKVISLAAVFIYFFAFSLATLMTRLHLVLWREKPAWALGITIAAIAVILVAQLGFSLIQRRGFFASKVFLVGDPAAFAKIRALQPSGNFAIMGEFENEARNGASDRIDLSRFVRASGAAEIVVTSRSDAALSLEPLLACKRLGIRVTDYAHFCEREAHEVDLSCLTPEWFLYSDELRNRKVGRFCKRAFDIAICLAGVALTAPLMLLVALAVKLESDGPVLYRQERVGLNGRLFTILKFRSMFVDAEQGVGPCWAQRRDCRITKVGALLRTFRIDELPQFFNVLRGDMSFIGPRPERPYFVGQLGQAIPYFNERHSVRPGITGWAQVCYPYGASVEDARRKLAFDLYYVKNQSLFLDLLILARTLEVVLWPEGAR